VVEGTAACDHHERGDDGCAEDPRVVVGQVDEVEDDEDGGGGQVDRRGADDRRDLTAEEAAESYPEDSPRRGRAD
jgi:hypothetical protein